MTRAIDAVVIGATGYVGGELLRLIAGHPSMRLGAAVSTSRAGTAIGALYPALASHYGGLSFVAPEAASASIDGDTEVALFSAAPHGASAGAVATLADEVDGCAAGFRIVDVSADFRYPDAASFEAVYDVEHPAPSLLPGFRCALPEHLDDAGDAHIGHPGCFATALLLATVPLVATGLVGGDLFATAITGSTGSGRRPAAGTHHPERHANLYAYKALAHRHVPEVERLIANATGRNPAVHFVPHSGPFARGIYATVQARLDRPLPAADVADALRGFYAGRTFVRIVDGAPKLKDVVTSNFCHLGVATDGDVVCVHAAIDNLVKGAAGGALQWMNRLWSLPEDAGLTAPAPAWL